MVRNQVCLSRIDKDRWRVFMGKMEELGLRSVGKDHVVNAKQSSRSFEHLDRMKELARCIGAEIKR